MELSFFILLLCIIQSPPFLNVQHMCNLDNGREYQHNLKHAAFFNHILAECYRMEDLIKS